MDQVAAADGFISASKKKVRHSKGRRIHVPFAVPDLF
jgi:hypothetical protein